MVFREKILDNDLTYTKTHLDKDESKVTYIALQATYAASAWLALRPRLSAGPVCDDSASVQPNRSPNPQTLTLVCSHTAVRSPSLPF